MKMDSSKRRNIFTHIQIFILVSNSFWNKQKRRKIISVKAKSALWTFRNLKRNCTLSYINWWGAEVNILVKKSLKIYWELEKFVLDLLTLAANWFVIQDNSQMKRQRKQWTKDLSSIWHQMKISLVPSDWYHVQYLP